MDGTMNTSGLLQETRSIHDSMNMKLNFLLIFTFYYKYLVNKIIYYLGIKQFCI